MDPKKPKPRKNQSEKMDKKSEIPETEIHDETKKVFDMGGIPQRDLKKNLGCG